jgi:hypothetical protein
MPYMENPAGQGGAPKQDDIAGGNISSDLTMLLRQRQAAELTRRCAISLQMATIVAPHLFGDGWQ